jgi:hypothetical protein
MVHTVGRRVGDFNRFLIIILKRGCLGITGERVEMFDR